MNNRWNIPDWLEREVIERDKSCIYCGVEFKSMNETRKFKPTWEHIVNDARIINRENIARCCFSCNASKGTKNLANWLETNYCKKNGITKDTIAEVAKMALINQPKNRNLTNIQKLENELSTLSSSEKADLAKRILTTIDPSEMQCIMDDMRKCKKDINHFVIYPWMQQAEEDLGVAKTEVVPSFIRCYHAQQAMEKILKAAFVVVNGKFHINSQALVTERKNFKINVPSYIPNSAWELNKGVQLPCTHNLIYLWKRLGEYDQRAFVSLNDEQKQFMKRASDYAVKYRYPYFSKDIGSQVGYLSDNDVQEVVKIADILCADTREFICSQIKNYQEKAQQ